MKDRKSLKWIVTAAAAIMLASGFTAYLLNPFHRDRQTYKEISDTGVDEKDAAAGIRLCSAMAATAEQEKDSSPQKTENNINLSKYLLKECKWEMGSQVPVPGDFFDKAALKKETGKWEELLEELSFEKPIDEEMLSSRGKYLVYILYDGNRLEGHLAVTDTIAPVISVPEQTEYEINDTISYRKDVSVTDNSGETLKLIIDNSDVQVNVAGTYTVYYSAVDSAGNLAEAASEIVIKEGHHVTTTEINQLADELLSELITADMTQQEQLKEIFDWCYNNIRYTYNADKSSLEQGVYDGIYYRTGDCFTFYATAAFLMDRLEIENLPVSRKHENATHYWSLVKVDSGWYHFDCAPHKGYQCFLQTDQQVRAYAQEYELEPDYFTFDETDMPERSGQIIVY